MSEWKKMKLSECCNSIADGDHQPPPKAEAGIPFVTISNMTSTNQFDFSDTLFVRQDYYDKLDEKRKARKDDILYSVVGSFGIPVFMKEDKAFVFQRHIAILRPDNKVIVPRFLFYTMLTKDFYAKADAAALGAAQRTVSLTSLRNMEISIPDKIQQIKIVDTLAAYDDLIENNQKQIKLLEEAAQRLYKEWFVNLRFPGYETTSIIDGVPAGWKKEPLGKALQVVRGRSYSSKELSEKEGLLMVNLSNIRPYGGYNRDQEKHYAGKVNENQFVATHDLLMGVTDMTQERRTVGRVAIVPNLHTKAMISMDLIKLVPVEGSPLFYYSLLNYGGYSEVISRFANGTNVLHLRPDVLDIVDAVIPDIGLQRRFVEFFENIQNRVDTLQDEIIIAAEARDRLLPKLMSGELEK